MPRSENKSNSGYYLKSSEDETYFPGRAAQIVAYGQVKTFFQERRWAVMATNEQENIIKLV